MTSFQWWHNFELRRAHCKELQIQDVSVDIEGIVGNFEEFRFSVDDFRKIFFLCHFIKMKRMKTCSRSLGSNVKELQLELIEAIFFSLEIQRKMISRTETLSSDGEYQLSCNFSTVPTAAGNAFTAQQTKKVADL